jgi:2-amino-4-hydroxy-6-hydroxymethyldihydropteridine diphosphokinase
MSNERINTETFYLSLGGNEEDSLGRIKQSIASLAAHSDIFQVRHAHFYSTFPVEVDTDRWFVNTVCSLKSTLSLHNLFRLTQEIETQMGKITKPKTASRAIDIDILFAGESTSRDEVIEVPHPRWSERLFVLIPLSDLTPMITFGVGESKRHCDIKQMIVPLLARTPTDVVLLEKNPDL